MKEKNNLISFLQVWGILLVVIGHSFNGVPLTNPIINIKIWIYSFHMPLFMFISGFLLKYCSDKKNISLASIQMLGSNGFIWKKIKRLLLPCVIISSIAFIPKVLMSKYALRPITFSFTDYLDMFIYPSHNAIIYFWFLPTLFIIFMIVMAVTKIIKWESHFTKLLFILIFALIINLYNPAKDLLLLNIEGVCSYFFYFVLGIYASAIRIHEYNFKHIYLLILCSFVISIVLINVPTFFGLDTLASLNGIFLSILLANVYVKKECTFFNHLFGASYVIYLLSWFPQTASQQVLTSITNTPYWAGNILSIISGTYLPYLIYRLIISYKENKIIKYLSLSLGMG